MPDYAGNWSGVRLGLEGKCYNNRTGWIRHLCLSYTSNCAHDQSKYVEYRCRRPEIHLQEDSSPSGEGPKLQIHGRSDC